MRLKDHTELFSEEDYQRQFRDKRVFEDPCAESEVESTLNWTRSEEYHRQNMAREGLVINPAKACQPLGAVLCALGFERTLPFVHGSQGCTAYFRSHLSRHFKEPVAAVSSSMTEDAAVFGGLNNMIAGLENAYALYKPKMIGVSTTCMAEVIGDDIKSFIETARLKSDLPTDLYIPFAHTPSFVGSHLTGYDNMMAGIFSYMTEGKRGTTQKTLNIIPGFDTYTENIREVKRMLSAMGVAHTILSDYSDTLDSPNTGVYNMYHGGTPIESLISSINSLATITFQRTSSVKTETYIKNVWEKEFISIQMPIGIKNTDAFLSAVFTVTGNRISEELLDERDRTVDAIVDSYQYVHGKRFAIVGDPDLLLGLISFIQELGGDIAHVVCTNGDKPFEEEAVRLLSSNGTSAVNKVHLGKDMWHLRSMIFNEPVDMLIGNSYAKFIWKDTATPFVRVGFPIFDRHHMHRFPIIGYRGALNLLSLIVNTILEEMDRASMYSPSFDLIR